jgi:hypothetical protein
VLTTAELSALLADQGCPFAPDTGDILNALREDRQPRRGRIIAARELARFVNEMTGEQPTARELDALMRALGATRLPLVDLDGIAGRTFRRLAGRRVPRRYGYEVPAPDDVAR